MKDGSHGTGCGGRMIRINLVPRLFERSEKEIEVELLQYTINISKIIDIVLLRQSGTLSLVSIL
jgi:hypothetical protein